MPLPGFVDALKHWAEPGDKDWFAYKMSERNAQQAVAASLSASLGMPFVPEDIAMTNGAFGAISAAFHAILEAADEVVFCIPPWFNYAAMIVLAGAVPVKVKLRPETFDLDLDAIAAAITRRTRIVIVNAPHNPTGRVYPPETLTALAGILTKASERYGRPIYLLSDEPYNRLVFDGRPFHSPVKFYAHAFITFSYAKILLTPGMRIGYLALPPTMPLADRERLRRDVATAQVNLGWLYPNALLQHAIEDLEKLSIDIAHLQRKRDRLVEGLRAAGYEVHSPEGAFYLLPKSPAPDDIAFAERLAQDNVYVMPGTVCEIPGYLRLCFTASDDMIARSLPVFARAIREVGNEAAAG
jgi:aspartate aminotransferase